MEHARFQAMHLQLQHKLNAGSIPFSHTKYEGRKKFATIKKKKKKLKRRKTTSANKTSCEVIKVEYSQKLDTANTVKILALL